ncbi:siderophore-interacting protein [Nocardia neocaledoniensis NBRC 108232]|uniref:NADPH-dependent ferric siderophore reductase n=1 Tax=Nocardia neocaledoniensis TaxID=236511 RepID=A0A317N444_9NOCA|nr:siderophore-interacting protein [Nocardia neocaledoniensis]PWV69842.1 NADPH-dependent ferric siderophore reductase [Nocardia neocaledoniensis]GEM34765.1 siderophore-interacting protein [Nocardia neocaledoniensis NBRC 108232]
MTSAAVQRPTMAYATMRVRRVVRLTPRMVRVTFDCADAAALADTGPDQYTKVFFPLPGQTRPVVPPPIEVEGGVMSWYQRYLAMPDEVRPPMRTYTVRAQRPELGELDIDFALHPDHAGPASDWASAAAPGDEIGVLCPPHALYCPPPDPDWQLLVGDETAIPAIGAIVERLATGAVLRAYIEVAGPDDEQRFETRGDVRIDWVHRGARPHGAAVVDAVCAATLPGGAPYAWISGEANLVKLVRRELVRERGVDKRAITFTGYWRQGRTEEDNGREKVRRAAAGEPLVDED